MRYSEKKIKRAKITIVIDIEKSQQRPIVKVIDYGDGIDKNAQQHIFEPFYTTETTGTGLGLYLCKELSEANQANLSYYYHPQHKYSTFKLVLAHPHKRIELE